VSISPWAYVKPGNPDDVRTAKHLAAQAQRNESLRAAGAVYGMLDSCGPPTWDRSSWEAYKAQTGSYPFSAGELPPSFDQCPVWAYELMGLRPPLMAQQ